MLEPVPGEPVAIANCGSERVLVVADYHAGIEIGLRREGVEIASRGGRRRNSLLRILDENPVDRLLFLGDLIDSIGEPNREERVELRELLEAVTATVPVTIVKGNHDGRIEERFGDVPDTTITDGDGIRIGDVGFCHGHAWPSESVVAAPYVCTAHEHPQVRLVDSVGGTRTERVWLRGNVDPAGFENYGAVGDRLVVCPAFNELSGGTVINQEDRFLSPFLPDGLSDGEVYLLDGTRLGPYGAV